MKISDTIKTAPWQGILESGLSGLGSLVSGLTQIGAAKRQHKYNMLEMEQEQKYALEQMQQSQEYNLANMAQQNQYQIDAEKRAQEWNDVGAQIERGQRAGVSALATLGAGSSQSMGVSSSPSSSTPSPAGAPSSKGVSKPGMNFDTSVLGKMVQQGRLVSAQIEGIEAENDLKEAEKKNVEEDTKLKQQQYDSISWYNQNARPLEQELRTAGVSEAKSKALVADIKAKLEVWKNTEKTEEGYTIAQQELVTAIDEARALIGKYNADAGLATESAEDMKGTRDSRNAANNASARNNNASAVGKELSNRDYEYYGIDKNTDFLGVPLLPLVRWFEDLDRAVHNENPKGLAKLLQSIVFALPEKITGDANSIIEFIKATWQNTFGTVLPDKDAKELYTLTVPQITSNTGQKGRPHSGPRMGITMSK